MTPDPRVMPITKRQPEYIKPAGAYVNSLASAGNASTGMRKEKEWRKTFDAVEKQYGVERWLILSFWGIETSFGADKDKWDVIRSLATLAYEKYRDPYFRNELLVALKILQEGHIARKAFVSSWAGAMGQTQFMPTNFFDYAVDFLRRWPSRHLEQRAGCDRLHRELHAQGRLDAGHALGLRSLGAERLRLQAQSRGTFAQWNERGVKRTDGGDLSGKRRRHSVFPDRLRRPRFPGHGEFQRHKDVSTTPTSMHWPSVSSPTACMAAASSALNGRKRRRSHHARTASPCRRSWPLSATRCATSPAIWISTCATPSGWSR